MLRAMVNSLGPEFIFFEEIVEIPRIVLICFYN
jgi:hypothetical protein